MTMIARLMVVVALLALFLPTRSGAVVQQPAPELEQVLRRAGRYFIDCRKQLSGAALALSRGRVWMASLAAPPHRPSAPTRGSAADEPELLEKRHDLARLLEPGVGVFKEHLDHFLGIRPQLVERLALAVSPREPGHPRHVQARVSVPLDDCREVVSS